jgi:hypothetical protein
MRLQILSTDTCKDRQVRVFDRRAMPGQFFEYG